MWMNTLFFIGWVFLTAFFVIFVSVVSMVAAYKQLEYTKTEHVEDGKTDVLITLRLGPFSYTIDVPERKEK